ncbi:MAG TPA: cupredoxin family copper-binding protein [Longimicrobiales bacterium]
MHLTHRALLLTCALGLAAGPAGAAAQSVLERSPNLGGAWVGQPGMLYFNFLHRFNVGDPPIRKVTNTPTFLLGAGLPGHTMVALQYATSSLVAGPTEPNELELSGRWSAVRQEAGAPLDVSVQAAYNTAAGSPDAEVTLARQFGAVRLAAAARVLGRGYDRDTARYAVGGGAIVKLGRYFALAGDVVSLLDRREDEALAWSAALQIAIPYTPHTISLHAANTNTATLQGSSIGLEDADGRSLTRWGFEFTIPITLSRYLGGRAPVAAEPPAGRVASGDVVRVVMRQLSFAPAHIEVAAGTTVEWFNDDQLVHTVKADDGSWDSGDIAPGGSWRHTFDRPGTYTYTCTPHPFMKAVVVVK